MTHAGPAPFMLSVSGCRGIFGQSITPEVTARFAGVLGVYLRERWGGRPGRPRVVLGRDGRLGGDVLARAAAAGLAGAGCDVTDLGVAMTATVGVMADARGAAGGLVVTASHNPQEWNGLKPILRSDAALSKDGGGIGFTDASAPSKATADELIRRYHASAQAGPAGAALAAGATVDRVGIITQSARGGPAALDLPDEGTHTHLDKVREALMDLGAHDDRRSVAIRCVVDSVNASGVRGARELLGPRLIHHLGAGDSGLFPHPPEPTRENLTGLCRFVGEKRADAGFAQDPDADRLAVVDERGVYIGEEYTLVLAAMQVLGVLAERAGKDGHGARGAVLCTNLSTSRMLEDVAARYGARVIRTAVGEANVVEAMKREGAVLGGEGNGGVIWPRVTYIRDSLGAMGLIIALLARTGKKLSELVAEVPSYAIVKRKVDLADLSEAARAADAVARAFAAHRLDRQDGVRVDFDLGSGRHAWLHVRGSNTEPIMRLIAEAPSEAEAEAILADASKAIGQQSPGR